MFAPLPCLGLLLLLLRPAPSRSALPPGYEDRTFCPPGYCLGRRHPKPGLVGPKSLFWECRWGDGSPKDKAAFRPAQAAAAAAAASASAAAAADGGGGGGGGSGAVNPDADADEHHPVRHIASWGPKLNGADDKLVALLSNGYHERLCLHLHAPLDEASGGIHTVYVPNDLDEDKPGVLHRMGLDPDAAADTASMSGVLAAAGGLLCFVLFCCVSSAMGAASSAATLPPRSGDSQRGDSQHRRDRYGGHTAVNFETDKYR